MQTKRDIKKQAMTQARDIRNVTRNSNIGPKSHFAIRKEKQSNMSNTNLCFLRAI